jgi:hypothetical protein
MIRRNGFVYNGKTSEAFVAQKEAGAVFPSMRVVEMIAKLAATEYRETIADLKRSYTYAMDSASDNVMSEALITTLKKKIKLVDPENTTLRNKLLRALAKAQREWFENLFKNPDADDTFKIRVAYSLDREKVFLGRLKNVQRVYVDKAVEKIGEGQSQIRKNFIGEFQKYLTGDSDMETVNELLSQAREEAGSFSRFFARDQMQRFDKSMVDASMDQAGADGFKVICVGDGRTRKTHRLLHKKYFPRGTHVKELDEYCCRCRKVPVFKDLE